MNNQRYTIRCAIYLLLIKDTKIFLVRRRNTGWEDGKYCFPGGHLEPNEKLSDAVKREAKEEAGIEVDFKDVKFIQAMHRRSNVDYIDLFFMASKWIGEPKNAEEDKADDAGWFPVNNLPENILPHQKVVLKNYKKNIIFSELGF